MLPKTFLAVAMAAAISYSLSAFATDPISNIFCKNNTYGTTSELVTLPSNVGANYYSPDIRFTDENNNPFSDIFDYRAYAGDDLHIQMVLTAQNKIGKISLYRASVHVGRRSGLSQVLATSRGPSLSLKGALENRGLSSNLMAKSSNTLLFAGAAADEFVTYDLVTGKSQSFHLQVNLANPRFSVGADLVTFEVFKS